MNTAHLIVITDLDGTLLDEQSYRYDASLPAVRKLQAAGIPLVLCSSKTGSEMELLWRELELRDPFICENGGAIWFPTGYFPFAVADAKPRGQLEMIAFGTGITILRRALKESASGLALRIRSFGEMSVEDVSRLTGLPREQASLALQREYDEPFIVEGEGTERLFAALRDRGFTVTFGGRLFHVTGGHDKGHAVRRIHALYRRMDPACVSVGLGNSGNDLPLLREVDRPILIRNADGSYDEETLRAMPEVERTLERGPYGWRSAIAKILADKGEQVC
ncbi:MAG TPA: HAD-IIB family hydrolase [Candidatus Binatia bacterium]|nr:HAD-IIB family hydrolase [Candidatus Binatia bacterium]